MGLDRSYSLEDGDDCLFGNTKKDELLLSPPPLPTKCIKNAKSRNDRRPGACLENEKDPQTRLIQKLRVFYRDLACSYEANNFLVSCASALPPGSLSPAYFDPELEIQFGEHKQLVSLSEILSPITFEKNIRQEAPRKVLIEGESGIGKTSLALKLLHCWATQNNWIGSSITLLLFIPLNELHDKTILQYIVKELIPNISRSCSLNNAVGDFEYLWKYRFNELEDKLLFVLDGFESVSEGNEQCIRNLNDLISGRIFPKCRLVITSSFTNQISNLFVNRKLKILGREWSQVKKLFSIYFNYDAEKTIDIIRIIENSDSYLRVLSQAPLGWFCISLLFEYCNYTLPNNKLELYEKMIRCLINKKMSIDHSSAIDNISIIVNDFGKFALGLLKKTKKSIIKKNQMVEFGLLNKNFSFGHSQKQARKLHQYSFIHVSFAEYLSAFYIYTRSKNDSILKKELQDLPGIKENNLAFNSSTVSILQFLMGLLRSRAYVIFSLLEPKEFPSDFFMNLPKFGGPFEKNISKVCELLGFAKNCFDDEIFNDHPPYPRVNCTSIELEGWSHLLVSDFCSVTRFEIFYQSENNTNFFLDIFFGALSFNKSVTTIRLFSIFDQDCTMNDIGVLMNSISMILKKPNLKEFELVISCFSDTSPLDFQCVVDEICFEIEHAFTLHKIVIDMNLNSAQISQLLKTISKLSNISVLHLPHSLFDMDNICDFEYLLRQRTIGELNINDSCWSLSGNNTSMSGTMTTLSKLKKNYKSLSIDKCDKSRISRMNSLPTNSSDLMNEYENYNPCDCSSHTSVFHSLFSSIKHSSNSIYNLSISKCKLTENDIYCLSECIKRTKTLRILLMENCIKFSEMMPILQGIRDNFDSQLVQMNFASTRMILTDSNCKFLFKVLTKCKHLRSLNLNGWIFHIESDENFINIKTFFALTNILNLSIMSNQFLLKNVLNENEMKKYDSIVDNKSIQVLKMQNFQLSIRNCKLLFVGKLANFFKSFQCLQELNLDLDKSRNELINETDFVNCMRAISKIDSLRKFSMQNWTVVVENENGVFNQLNKILRNCKITVISIRGFSMCSASSTFEHLFVKVLFANLQRIVFMNMTQIPFSVIQMKCLGNTLKKYLSVGQTSLLLDNNVVSFIVEFIQNSSVLRIAFINGQNHLLKMERLYL